MDFEQAAMWRRLSNEPGEYYTQAAVRDRDEFRAFVEGLLHEGTITVEFVKANGETRVMICTLNEEKGAKYSHNDTSVTPIKPSARPRSQDVRTVWDCTAGAWRSFRWDRLKKVEFTIG